MHQRPFARHVVDAIGFALYLPGIEMTLASKLHSPDVGERQMLFEHLDKLRDNDMLVLDRCYPAYWLFAALTQRGRDFFMRADSLNLAAIRSFRRSGLTDQIVTLPAPAKKDALDYEIAATPCQIRLIRQVFGQKVRALVTPRSWLSTPTLLTHSARSTTPAGELRKHSAGSSTV